MFLFNQLADQHAWQDVEIPCFKSAASPTRTVRAGGETDNGQNFNFTHVLCLLCCALLCCALLCFFVLCCALLCFAVLCCALLCCAMLYE